jgi:enoyl-[acyl-carrier-protein] reductase (NADH)
MTRRFGRGSWRTRLRRAAESEDVAGVVLFLASDLAGVITGAVHPVEGGRTAH